MNIDSELNQRGFTLIEIMVVVVIIGLLSTMIIPNLIDRQDQAARSKAKNDVRAYASMVSMYKMDNFSYPSTTQGLKALTTNPKESKNWSPLVDHLQLDPWDNEYQYRHPGEKNPTKFDVWSFGADGVLGGEGWNKDIGNWPD